MKLHDPEKIGDVRIGKRIRHQRVNGVKHDIVTKSYVAQYKDPSGKWTHEALGTNRRMARTKALEIQVRIDAGKKKTVFKRHAVTELIEAYLASCASRGLAAKSYSKYKADLAKLEMYARENKIRWAMNFGEDEFHGYRRWLESSTMNKHGVPYAPKSVAAALLVAKQAYKWAAGRGKLLPSDPLVGVALPAKAKARPQACFTTPQVEQLLGMTESTERAVIAVLAYEGLRIGEVEQLRWSDVRLDVGDLGMLHVQLGGAHDLPKDKEPRFVPVHPRVRPLLESLPRRSVLVFPDIRERQFLARLKTLCREAGFENPNRYKTHSLRHHFASMCANHQVAYRKALTWLGHSSSTMLDLYYHLSDAESESAMKALAGVD